MIRARGLVKSYGPIEAVRGIDFEIQSGEIVGLLGHNGAGKTTVLKMITGFIEPTAGSVSVDGRDVLDDPGWVQQRLGYLPESAPLYPEMLVQEYLQMMAALRGVPAERIDAAVIDAAKATGLTERMVQRIGTLSKGFRQRVGIAQAIIHDPPVVILDEPTSGLDPRQILEIRALVKHLAEKSTVILSTHILQEVEALCDRVIILIDGHVAADDALANLLQVPWLRFSVAAGTQGIPDTLRALDGIQDVQSRGTDPALDGFDLYQVEATELAPASAAIGKAAQENNWIIGALSAEHASLEGVFNRLMDAHLAEAAARMHEGESQEAAA